MSKFDYLRLADAIAAEIAGGALKPGDRLPPQRGFAYERKIAVSTASRVYTELLRRGLVVGEVGRGTFVSGEARRGITAPAEPRGVRIDLEFNYPLLPTQSAMIAKSLQELDRPEALDVALRPTASVGTPMARAVSAQFLSRGAWTPKADHIVFTANGRQCIAAALAALVPPGGRCGVEMLTYPFVKGIAARLGVTLVPLAMDENGVRPDAVQKAHCEARLSALYIQPVIHNPLGLTMPPARRADLLRVVDKLGLPVIEDASTASSTTIRRSPRWRRIPVSCSTASRRKWPRDWRSASWSRRRACAKASWRRCVPAAGRLPATRSRPASS